MVRSMRSLPIVLTLPGSQGGILFVCNCYIKPFKLKLGLEETSGETPFSRMLITVGNPSPVSVTVVYFAGGSVIGEEFLPSTGTVSMTLVRHALTVPRRQRAMPLPHQ